MVDETVVTQQLTKQFGSFTAVDHISFSVQKGEVVGYLGPNGSGKTTTIRMLLGLLRPSSGDAFVLGYDVRKDSEIIRMKVGYMSQKFALYNDLTVMENLSFYGGVYGVTDTHRLESTLKQVGLTRHKDKIVGSLSAGWRQRLALATAIVHHPRLLFLDEPTSGVDPTARRAFWDLIYELVDKGITALVTTHYMDEAEYCSRVGIMRNGKLLAMDTPSSLKSSALPGKAWDVVAQPILNALATLQANKAVLRAGLTGDHLRAITREQTTEPELASILQKDNVQINSITQVEPSLEDVFLSLAIQ